MITNRILVKVAALASLRTPKPKVKITTAPRESMDEYLGKLRKSASQGGLSKRKQRKQLGKRGRK